MPIAPRSYQGSVPTRMTSRARKECAVRMMAPMLNGFFARSTAIRNGWRMRSSSCRISSLGMANGGTLMASLPLDAAAHRGDDLEAHGSPLEHGVEGGPEIPSRHLGGVLPRVVDATVVGEAPVRVEDEDVGSAGGVVGARHFLRLVPEVGEVETALGGPRLHDREGVLRIGGGVVR